MRLLLVVGILPRLLEARATFTHVYLDHPPRAASHRMHAHYGRPRPGFPRLDVNARTLNS